MKIYKFIDKDHKKVSITDTGKNINITGLFSKLKKEIGDNQILPYIPPTLEEVKKDKKDKLKLIAEDYVRGWLDDGMRDEFNLSRALFESGTATALDLPKAAAVGAWLTQVWGDKDIDVAAETGTYYAQKKYILDGNDPSYEFSQFDPLAFDFHDLDQERKAFLGGL